MMMGSEWMYCEVEVGKRSTTGRKEDFQTFEEAAGNRDIWKENERLLHSEKKNIVNLILMNGVTDSTYNFIKIKNPPVDWKEDFQTLEEAARNRGYERKMKDFYTVRRKM
ncbi:hypothetical protein WA026_000328 [Henosepilachna vigintioctopunctata]|uniref:Uncharacterized protein n=1 Tax=Henosepilachna vigintioctopunctata TaxID=420089 RepID=A0AAW1V4U0_9CUCU